MVYFSLLIVNKQMLQNLFILIMLCLNILFIAIPSIRKYLDGGVFIEVSVDTSEKIVFPAVTIARIGLDGW